MTIGFDTLRAVETLTDAGIDAIHARAIVSTMYDAVLERFAPKSDVAKLQTDMAAVKVDIDKLKTDVSQLKTDVSQLKTDVADLKAGFSVEIADLKREIANVQATLTWRIVLAIGAFAALSRLAM